MYGAQGILFKLVAVPLMRVEGTPLWGRVVSVLVGCAEIVRGDLFLGILLLLVASNALDWYHGRAVAKIDQIFDPHLALYGLHSKVAGIALVLLIRGFEAWLAGIELADGTVALQTHGFVSIAIAVALFANDVESISLHRERMGARPIPILSSVVGGLRQLAKGLVPTALRAEKQGKPPPPPERRRQERRKSNRQREEK